MKKLTESKLLAGFIYGDHHTKEYVYLPGTRHETYCSDDRTMEMYLDKIMKFLDSCSGEMFSHYEVLRE